MDTGGMSLVRHPNRQSTFIRTSTTLAFAVLVAATPLAETVAQVPTNAKPKISQAADSLTLVKPYPGIGITVLSSSAVEVTDIRMRDFVMELHRIESNLPPDRKTGIDKVVINPELPEYSANMKSDYSTVSVSINSTTVLVGTGVFNPQSTVKLPNGLVEVTDLTSESNDPKLFADYAIAQKVYEKLPSEDRQTILNSICAIAKAANYDRLDSVFELSTYVEGSQLPKISSYIDFFYCASLVMMNKPGEFMVELKRLSKVDKDAYTKAVDFAALVIKAFGEGNFHSDLVRFVTKPSAQ